MERLKPEERDPGPARYDAALAALLETHLADLAAQDQLDYHFSCYTFLYPVVLDAMPQVRDLQRACSYLDGRVRWHLGLQKQRPPRSWKVGHATHYQTSGERGLDAYECLNEIGRRLAPFWLWLAAYDGLEREGEDLFNRAREARVVRRALAQGQRSLLPGARQRLSPLAA